MLILPSIRLLVVSTLGWLSIINLSTHSNAHHLLYYITIRSTTIEIIFSKVMLASCAYSRHMFGLFYVFLHRPHSFIHIYVDRFIQSQLINYIYSIYLSDSL